MKSSTADTRLQTQNYDVRLEGFKDIMFDRYAGDNDTRLTWQEKIYLRPGTNELVLPVTNILSFFTATNTQSAPKRLRDTRKYKVLCNALQSFLEISNKDGDQDYLTFYRDDKPIIVGDFDKIDGDTKSGIYLHRSVARLDKGIPNPKERPTLKRGWQLHFTATLFQNKSIKISEVKNLLMEGGVAIGLGTYRGVFGKFFVDKFELVS